MVNAMFCRIHQSGHLAKLNPRSLQQVTNGVRIYKETLQRHLPSAGPFFPVGMPSIADTNSPVALGVRTPEKTAFVPVWRLNGPPVVQLTLPHSGKGVLLYPVDLGIRTGGADRQVTVTFPRTHMAAILEWKRDA